MCLVFEFSKGEFSHYSKKEGMFTGSERKALINPCEAQFT